MIIKIYFKKYNPYLSFYFIYLIYINIELLGIFNNKTLHKLNPGLSSKYRLEYKQPGFSILTAPGVEPAYENKER
jgi:hypothetical protein